MADGTAWRTALGALSALGLGVVGVGVVPVLLPEKRPASDVHVAAPDQQTGVETVTTTPPAPSVASTTPKRAEPRQVAALPDGGTTTASGEDGTADPTEAVAGQNATTAPAPDNIPAQVSPSLDTVRVEPDGTGLVAGRAEPGSEVAILADDGVAARVTADPDGRFVAFFALSPSAEPRILSLRDEDGATSPETVIVAPNVTTEDLVTLRQSAPAGSPPATAAAPVEPEAVASAQEVLPSEAPSPSEPEASSALPDTSAERLGARDTEPEAPASAPEPSVSPDPAPEVAVAAPSPPAAVEAPAAAQDAVLLSDADGVRVVQPALPPGASPEVLATVALDAIAYDGSGEVVLSGRATDQGAVRLYLDNTPVADAVIAADGTWTVPLTDADPGLHNLRVDQLDATGAVVSRIETPFQREERVSLAAAVAEANRTANGIALRTVQPGNTLWAIARERYGEPRLYLRVFEANRDRIRNPDLIYPGQVFVLPTFD